MERIGRGGNECPCSALEDRVQLNTAGEARRTLLRFDDLLNVVPADAMIARARLNLRVLSDAGFPASSVDVRAITKSWTNAVTWNTRNGSLIWTTPGSDRSSEIYSRGTLTPNGDYQNLDVSELVQAWAEGGGPDQNGRVHHGFEIEKTTAAPGGDLLRISSPVSTNAPSLTVDWDPRTGIRKGNSTAVTQTLSDRTSVSVNPATGNAIVTTRDLTIAGVDGLDLNVAHSSHSLDTGGLGDLGYGWTTSLGGARIHPDGGVVGQGSLFYTDGNGGQWTYLRDYANALMRPKGLDSDISYNSTGGGLN